MIINKKIIRMCYNFGECHYYPISRPVYCFGCTGYWVGIRLRRIWNLGPSCINLCLWQSES